MPTGVVTISGTASRDQVLTASHSLADADGLGTISYQWKAGGVNIAGATGSSYTLTQAEVGKTITVTASYTDLLNTPESVDSAATTTVTALNNAPTGAVTFTGTATQGQTLTAANTLADADGLGAIAYQWNANGASISGATNPTLVLGQAQVGKTITVTANYTDGRGASETLTSAASGTVAALPQVQVTGNVQDGYIAGAAIYIDANGNGVADASENTGVFTDVKGNFSLATSQTGPVIAVGGTNVDTGLANILTLTAPQDSTVINPLTTVIQAYVKSTGASTAVAESAIQKALGITADVDLTKYDALSQSSSDPIAISVQRAVAQVAQVGTRAQEGGVQFSTIASTLATGVKDGLTLNLADRTSLQTILGSVATSQILDTAATTNGAIASATTLQAISSIQVNAADCVAPTVVKFAPLDEATGVTVDSDLVITFNEAIQRGTSSIILKTAAGTTVAIYAPDSSNLTFMDSTLTVNPAANLSFETQFKLEFSLGSVRDIAGNLFLGTTTYNFTTLAGPISQTILGTANSDLLTGGTGNDTIDGGAGIDMAAYSGKITDYYIKYNRALSTATITDHRTSGDGTDNLKSIEKLQFSDKTFELLNPTRTESAAFGKSQSFLFDPSFYLLQNPDLVPTVTLATAFDSYKSKGAAAGAAPNAWFDPVYYANKWADLKALNLDAATLFAHYNLYGVWEGRSAGPIFDKFDGTRYLGSNPDVAAYVDAYVKDFLGSRSNGAIAHFLIYGANEGRLAYDTAGVIIEQAILIGTPG